MNTTEFARDLVAAVAKIPGLRPATQAGPSPLGWQWDALAVDVIRGAGGGDVVIRAVATRLPLPPIVRQAEQALLAVVAARRLPIARMRLEITEIDGAAFGTGKGSPE
ncbi:hypothetical protein [Actinophytocola gossypii]|uniref:Asp23/Gls24 family envelope stress response protein n=1 Tax=Actinophytocola gossypii TaxID=2812003 RepID=A0ABT2JJ78_9PSEU|nr:hypothetical protein [Actinophytocola gossypii]MCT2587939.1 hypothetical protein [Actinophytocola gossypii]